MSGKRIAEMLVARIKRGVRGRLLKRLQRTVAPKEDLAHFQPAHAAYIFAQNQMSAISEQLTALDEMAPFARIISKAEDLYMPGGPPTSPLTASYFTGWAFFDACAGPANETIGTTASDGLAFSAVCRAIVPAGYRGRRGELWYARVLPPPIPGSWEHVVFTTPYILLRPGPREWRRPSTALCPRARARHASTLTSAT